MYHAGFPVQGPRPPFEQPGVPTPYAVHVHPYPTRYHGGIWRRPVFCKPYVSSPQAVFKPSDFYEGNPGIKGLGALQYQTHRGIYGPNVHGGGVFSRSLGAAGDYERYPWRTYSANTLAKQQSVNMVLDQKGYARIAEDGKLNPQTCGAIRQFAPGGVPETCLTFEAPAKKGSGSYPWGAVSADTRKLQKATNVALREFGYATISEDGKLGAGTCGARKTLREKHIPGMVVPTSCQSYRAPLKAGAAARASRRAPTAEPALAYKPPSRFPWAAVAAIGAGAVVAGGAYWAVKK